jgi:hypothetical protein
MSIFKRRFEERRNKRRCVERSPERRNDLDIKFDEQFDIGVVVRDYGNDRLMLFWEELPENCSHRANSYCDDCLDKRFLLNNRLVPQSAEVITASETKTDDATADHVVAQTIQFLDEDKGHNVGFYREIDPTSNVDYTPSAELGDFLSRPVNITTFTWLESDPIGTAFSRNPWFLFFNNDKVKYKLNNYAFFAV